MGIDLSPKKLRAFMRIWGGESEEQDNMELVVHLKGWTPHTIKLDSEQAQKSLGVIHDTHTSSINQLNAMEQTLEHYLGVILKRKGSIEMKKMVVDTSLNKKILYMAKFCTLSIKEFRILDVPYNKFYRKLFKMNAYTHR